VKLRFQTGAIVGDEGGCAYNRRMKKILAFFTLLAAATAMANPHRQDLATIEHAVSAWLDQSLLNSPGKVSYQITPIDARLRLAPCQEYDIGLPPGYRLAGKTMVRVACVGGASWRINVPVHVSIKATYYIAARPLAAGKEIREGDLQAQEGDLASLPGSVVLDPANALGRVLNSAVAAGNPVRLEMLRAPIVIVQNQRVKVRFREGNIEIANEGVALSSAQEGQAVRVKVGNGQVITGTARGNGVVDVGD